MLSDLITKTRSYRKFDQSHKVSVKTLQELIDLSRLAPNAMNAQELRYILCTDPLKNQEITGLLNWAGRITEWSGPAEGERPSAYIIMLSEKALPALVPYNAALAGYAILLGATEKGLGGCMFHGIQRVALKNLLNITDQYHIELVIAIGKPTEVVQIDPVDESGSIVYFRDAKEVHHVPKRALKELIIREIN